ncbi:MAG TPA: hypothetical protein VG406_03990 [Isosphaeraceae bacterium]|jgi:hypothetical protein|nr:hypothetical protein [Isosphaeraceae bacterium]
MPRGARERRRVVGRALALACVLLAPAEAPVHAQGPAPADARRNATGNAGSPRPIFFKSRAFRIPFNIARDDLPRLREVQLWYSDDQGRHWSYWGRTLPDQPSFTFRTKADGEYWFAVRTQDTKGRLFPTDEREVEPIMKVIIDTTPPTSTLEPQSRRGGVAAVRFEVADEHLDLNSLMIEYQNDGASTWRRVPLARPARIGVATWDAGTADILHVRATVADRAGNRQEAELTLAAGEAADLASAEADATEPPVPPPIAPVSRPEPPAEADPVGPAPPVEADPVAAPATGAPDPNPIEPPEAGRGVSPPTGAKTLLVGSPRFALRYAVDDAGPGGPAVVELFATRDGGRTWTRLGDDPDRRSPFPVDLGGDGVFGLTLVARSASGLGDLPPRPGDPPQTWVEVDDAPPAVRLGPPRLGVGAKAGVLTITWQANDPHLGPRPVVISYRPDRPGAIWQQVTDPIPNSGRFDWPLPADVPPRFHVRVDVFDTVGNRGSADTTSTGPVLIDRTRPRSRIIGLDPSARAGGGERSRR